MTFCMVAATLAVAGPLTPETALSLEWAHSPTVDPGGRYVVFVRSTQRGEDEDRGGRWNTLWRYDLVSGEVRRLTRPRSNVGQPSFDPSGQWVGFTATRPEHHDKGQVFRLPIDGGEAEPLTEHPSGVGAYRWARDGKQLAFIATMPRTDEDKELREKGHDWTVVGEVEQHPVVWRSAIDSLEHEAIYEAERSAGALTWGQGDTVFVQAAPAPDADAQMMASAIWRVGAVGMAEQPLVETHGKLGAMAASPDGSVLAWLGATAANDPLPQSVFVAPADGGPPRNLTVDAEFSARQLLWWDDKTLLVLASRGTGSALVTVDVASARAKVVDIAGLVVDGMARAGKQVVVVGSEPLHPSGLYRVDPKTGQHKPLLRLNDLSDVTLAKQEVLTWTGPDDLSIEGVLTWPADYTEGRRYPLVVNPHGGPEGVSRNGFSTFSQLLSGRGFFVLQPNYRGSSGRGVAFSQGDHNDLGGKEFDDILAGIDLLVDKGWVDAERVGMGGWSYGGYLSALAATHHSERFGAAVMGAGISNWVAFTGLTDIPREMSVVHWNEWWLDNPDKHWARSPLSGVGKSKTPTLVVHGADDRRVPPGEGLALYRALEQRGVPTQMVTYPRAGHGVGERAHWLDLIERQLDWFSEHLAE